MQIRARTNGTRCYWELPSEVPLSEMYARMHMWDRLMLKILTKLQLLPQSFLVKR